MIPMFISMLEIEISRAYYLIPICNVSQILTELFTKSVDPINLIITFASTTLYAIIVISFIVKAYNSEKILFSN